MGSVKMKFIVVASLLFGIALGAPKNIKQVSETLPYTVVATHNVGDQSFEERNYEGGVKWVCTNSEMTDDNEMFMTLFQYIDGANSENENIDMTTPVSTKWQEDGFHEECFYLNQEHQANPPKPNSPNVYIVVRPAMTVFTRIVTRPMSAVDWMEESSALDNMIGSLGFEVESDVVYINGYSGPGSTHPKSEMWKIKKSLKNVKEDLETVPYLVVATWTVGQNSFEERIYDAGMKWVCTESNNDNEMFQKLYQYIAGSNSANENIDMTTPVSTKWHKGELHEECFYLNNEHQANPPKPNSPDVYIVTRPAMIIYTRIVTKHFWHQMTVADWMQESRDLNKMIEAMGFKIKEDEMYINGYTSPMAFNQRSELWKVKEM